MSGKEFSRAVKDEALERADGRCERCVISPVQTYHHRWRRVGPDASTLENCVALCHRCHEWIHANPAESLDRGWLAKPPPVDMGPKAS